MLPYVKIQSFIKRTALQYFVMFVIGKNNCPYTRIPNIVILDEHQLSVRGPKLSWWLCSCSIIYITSGRFMTEFL